ncbi:LxmA leader domain family RiPP [Kitasatospora sp. NPDC006697]|uniref:LxmA leader domain family RiPP n=1 Tax=Kitasatospora sp. NPDC006697 TaxID=3364020 RepID=UPI003686DEAD
MENLQSVDELLAGYSTYTNPEELGAAGLAPIIGTITIGETSTIGFTPESPATSVPCYLA